MTSLCYLYSVLYHYLGDELCSKFNDAPGFLVIITRCLDKEEDLQTDNRGEKWIWIERKRM